MKTIRVVFAGTKFEFDGGFFRELRFLLAIYHSSPLLRHTHLSPPLKHATGLTNWHGHNFALYLGAADWCWRFVSSRVSHALVLLSL
jgi:hypothetical protein